MDILAQLPRWKDCPYVVPNPDTLEPYHSVFNAWNTARIAAGLPDVRMHDLRHSCASNLVNSGQSLYVVGTILGHAQTKTTQRYAHLSTDTLLAAANAAADHMGADWARKTG
jgi:integrase